MARKAAKQQRKSTPHARGRAMWDKAFLAALRLHGNVSVACHVSNIDRSTAYRRRKEDETFASAWDDAMQEAGDWLEHEARRRAEKGTLKPVYHQGQLVGFERQYSDSLMTLLLKGAKPVKYADKSIVMVTPRQAAILEKVGKTAGDAFEELIQKIEAELKNA